MPETLAQCVPPLSTGLGSRTWSQGWYGVSGTLPAVFTWCFYFVIVIVFVWCVFYGNLVLKDTECFLIYFLRVLFTFRQRGREGKRERNINVENICHLSLAHAPTRDLALIQACVLNRNQTGDLLLCGTTLSQLSHTSEGQDVLFVVQYIQQQRTFCCSFPHKYSWVLTSSHFP